MTDDPRETSLKLTNALTEIANWWSKELKNDKALDFPGAALSHASEAGVSFVSMIQQLSAQSSP